MLIMAEHKAVGWSITLPEPTTMGGVHRTIERVDAAHVRSVSTSVVFFQGGPGRSFPTISP